MSSVDLGFAEECEPWELESRMFPSKLGGKPAWLDLKNLPPPEDLQCEVCKQQMIFLCQIYAPYEEDDENFHRTIFVFICRQQGCCRPNSASNVKVFRSGLKRENQFYSAEEPNGPDPDFSLSKWVNLCSLCGCFGEKHCSKCKQAVYCSREHQILHWKENHKQTCCSGNTDFKNSKYLFSEFVIAMEFEQKQEKVTVDEEEQIKTFEKLEAEGKTGSLKEVPEEELEKHAGFNIDKTFSHFKKQISTYPEQIIRYERGGKPLLIAKNPTPENIPACEYCGSARQFEFQVMPQMLVVLKETDVDWGVLLVYTCRNSCTNSSGYKREFVFKQDVSSDEVV